MDLNITGRRALVLGASSGLGRAVAHGLASEGCRVACASRTFLGADRTAQEIRDLGGDAIAAPWDLSDLGAMEAAVGEIERDLGAVDILFNNTGGPPPSAVTGTALQTWQQQFQSMFLSIAALTDRVLPAMRAAGWGRVITSTSSGVVAPIAGLAVSNAIRSSVHGWSKTLADEVASDGVTVNVVIPGRIATARAALIDAAKADREDVTAEEVAERSLRQIPVGRYGDPQEFASAVLYLASEQASYVTGTTIRVDGGLIKSVG